MTTSPTVVEARSLSKVFHIYNKPIDRLKQTLWPQRRLYREFYALRDVSFELRRGEMLGIIGVNGSGKSTLLQIVAGTLAQTTGELTVNGKVSALLELGSGFNPDFTGRENVFLSGSILGMSNQQIKRYLPEILDFAQIGDFIDQPVKIYSSGMFLRLAFSVYACLDPEILIVDEALAVGDAGFVHKCINRIRHLQARGIPIMLVTHDVDSVRSLCNRVMWLDEGRVRMQGDPGEVTSRYMQEIFSRDKVEADSPISQPAREGYQRWGGGQVRIENARLLDSRGRPTDVADWSEQITLEVTARACQDCPDPQTGFGVSIRNRNGLDVIAATTFDEGLRMEPWREGEARVARFTFPAIMAPGSYGVCACVEGRAQPVIEYFDYCENVVVFKVLSQKPIWAAVLPPIGCSVDVLGVKS